MLATQNLQELQDNLKEALAIEKVNLDRLREKVRQLQVIELGYRQCYAVAPVATDGGENNLSLEPMNVEIVRVVDSDGQVHFQSFLPLTGDPEKIGERLFQNEPILARLIQRLGLSDWRELSYLYFTSQDKADPDALLAVSDARRFIKTLRDILEWAVLAELAFQSGRPVFLLLRDGLLRTKFIKKQIFPNLAKVFKQAYDSRKAMILGVAKRSKALNYLSLALTLEGIFDRRAPCFAEVSDELEREAYTWAHTWMEGQCFGRLHLVKLVEGHNALVLPVDVPEWLIPRRKEAFEYLAETAKSSFPVLGYPYPLVKAHENANLSGLEIGITGDLMTRALMDWVDRNDKEKILRHITLGRGLITGGRRYGE
ncbi:hypothetical protein M1O18_00690 [Dehalococcoidia bacterium]|nr:hypothetical protein [Dehalococcoidia bacterium]